jgi:hypothetical protein
MVRVAPDSPSQQGVKICERLVNGVSTALPYRAACGTDVGTYYFDARGGRHEERGMRMSKTVQVRWGLLRPGATVISEDQTHHEHKVVTVEHLGPTVSVLFRDGIREQHSQDAYARVRLSETAEPRERERHGS